MKQRINRFIALLLMVSMVSGQIMPSALALGEEFAHRHDYTSYDEIIETNDVELNYAIEETNKNRPISRSFEELQDLGAVFFDADGQVTKVNTADTRLTSDEIALLLDVDIDAANKIIPPYEEAGLSKVAYENAVEYHGSNVILGRELSALNRGIMEDNLSEGEEADVRLLISSGYSYQQARAAIVTAATLDFSIDYLCEVKIAEIESEQAEENEHYEDYMSADTEDYFSVAVELGIPETALMAYMTRRLSKKNVTTQDVLDMVSEDMQTRYPIVSDSSYKMKFEGFEENTITEMLSKGLVDEFEVENAYGVSALAIVRKICVNAKVEEMRIRW